MESGAELQDLYSSTSSDDQSSVNSVIHVEALGDASENDAERSIDNGSRRETQNNGLQQHQQPGKNGRGRTETHPESGEMEDIPENGRYSELEEGMGDSRQVEFTFRDEQEARNLRKTGGMDAENCEFMLQGGDSSSEEDDDDRRQEEEAGDSDSSSTSEDTQIWVQHAKPRAHHPHVTTPNGQSRPRPPPKPAHHPGALVSPSGAPYKRQSLVSQSSSGKTETRLLVPVDDTLGAGDSGLSTESPETHSNQGDSVHYTRSDPQTSRAFVQYLPDPCSSTPHSGPAPQQPHPLAVYHSPAGPQTSLGLSYQHSSPSHLSSRASPAFQPSPVAPTLLLGNGEPSSGRSLGSPLEVHTPHIRENLFNVLSFLYAIFLVVLGVSLPLAEIFAHTIPVGTFEAFYIYLFGASILFLVYVYLFLLRSSTSPCCRRRRGHVGGEMEREDSLLNQGATWRPKAVYLSNNNHTGSFYLRLGAVGFGIGSMIHEGLMFGQLFERELVWECFNVAMVIRPAVQLLFTFVQLYFIFLNSKMLIHKYKVLARFGLMHMIATNLCVWIKVVISETVREVGDGHETLTGNISVATMGLSQEPEYREQQAGSGGEFDEVRIMNHDTENLPPELLNSTALRSAPGPAACFRHDLMGDVVGASSPYLYPCTIQYSLIAAGILFVMWRNIGSPPPITPSSLADSEPDIRHHHRHKKHNRVDCSGANRGLFFGIFTLVGVIISMILFFVLVDKAGFRDSAVIITHSSEVALHFLASLAIVIAAVRIRRLKFHADRDNHLEEMLLVVSLLGVYILGIFSIIAGRYMESTAAWTLGCPLVILSSVLVLFQATAQTVFIISGLRRSAMSSLHERRKPGREFVTFLLVCNIAMLGMNAFESLRSRSNPVAMNFYGNLAWNIVTHITTPLAIFYRFHSVVCLATIWKGAYKLKFQ